MSRSWYWLVAILGLEVASAVTIFHPQVQTIVLLFSTIVMIVLAWRRPAVASALLLSEYIFGSKGALLRAFSDGMGHGGVPLRMAWFGAFLLGWLMWAIQYRTYLEWFSYLRGRAVYVALALVLGYAFFRGYMLHNVFVLDDANAWGIWLLLLPALDLYRHIREDVKKQVLTMLPIALAWMMAKTLTLFYLFSHVTSPLVLDVMYLWVRRTGVGEITRALQGMNVWRVFFQSHVYLLPPIIFGFWYAASHRLLRWMWVGWIAAFATLIISLSRSLFLGAVMGLVFSVGLFLFSFVISSKEGTRFKPLKVGRLDWVIAFKAVVRVVVVPVVSLVLVAALFYAPPRSSGSLMNLIASRIDAGDAASMSRWELGKKLWRGVVVHPILGSGFGATITYTSLDPRIVATTGGVYTTYAFEWGWLDHWFKFGIVGIPLMLWIVLRLVWLSWKSDFPDWMKGALVGSLVGLMITHVFTPYLNHPLGFIWLIGMEAMLPRSNQGLTTKMKTA